MDLNVPEYDGKLLYNLVIKNHYTRALEIVKKQGVRSIFLTSPLTHSTSSSQAFPSDSPSAPF
jgi:hypothetical protein